MAARVVDLWRDRLDSGAGHARRFPRQSTGASLDERGREAAYKRSQGYTLPVAMAGTDPAFGPMVLQRRRGGLDCWLGVSDYVAAHVFTGSSQAGSSDREPLRIDRARVQP